MFKHFFVILILGAICCFLYGLLNIFMEVEENQCSMTYMFDRPQFSRVKFNENKHFPNYGLYYYYEGRIPKNVNEIVLNGAIVIFVPGNGGSYKQARSLASVALRKAMDRDTHVHFDYFTIDYNEELSGLYGGYLERQKNFLRASIYAVLRLYQKTDNVKYFRKVVLIGHSMGGKVAQALLVEAEIADLINTIIAISTPLDKPVVNLDGALSAFYTRTESALLKGRRSFIANNKTNFCGNFCHMCLPNNDSVSYLLENVLLISAGGGNRDVLVRGDLTTSQYSDIHAMTSSIPKVWLSCDHLSVVWCLQFVLVVNRFLFSIVHRDSNNYVSYEEDKTLRLQIAMNFFMKRKTNQKNAAVNLYKKAPKSNVWHESSKRVVDKTFSSGLRQTYNHMVSLEKFHKFKKLFALVENSDENDWLYGCTAQIGTNGKPFCDKATSLSHHINNLPSKGKSVSAVVLDLHNLKSTYKNWTHIVLRLYPSNKSLHFSVDIHDPAERYLHIGAPRWYAFQKKFVIEETMQSTSYYKLLAQNLNEPFKSLQIDIEKRACTKPNFNVITRICVPWARGYDRYQVLTESTTSSIYLNVPMGSPTGYNTTKNPVTMDIYLDPACRYSISYKFSFANGMSRVVQEFYFWLPAHLTAVLCIVLKNQISKPPAQATLKSLKPYRGFFQYTSLYVITGCRILRKLLGSTGRLPSTESYDQPFYISAILHSTAIVVSILATFGVWWLLMLHGNVLYKILPRLLKAPFTTSSLFESVIIYFPISLGALLIAVAFGSCSGVALLIACVIYLIILSNSYKDSLEDWLCKAAANAFKSNTTGWRASSSDDAGKECTELVEHEVNTETYDTSENNSNENPKEKLKESVDFCEGLQHFPFHISMFLLLFILTLLNAPATMAWVRNYGKSSTLPDTALIYVVIILSCLSFMWQFRVPYAGSDWRILSVLLYICASASVIYCQEAIYRLNDVIAIVFVTVLCQQMTYKLCTVFIKKN